MSFQPQGDLAESLARFDRVVRKALKGLSTVKRKLETVSGETSRGFRRLERSLSRLDARLDKTPRRRPHA